MFSSDVNYHEQVSKQLSLWCYFLKVSWGSVLPRLFNYKVCAAQKCVALVSLNFEKRIIARLDTVFSRLNAPGVYLKKSAVLVPPLYEAGV